MKDVGETVRAWWLDHLRPEHDPSIGEDTAAARALRARLRRPGAPTEALAERAVHKLAQQLPFLRRRPYDLIQLVRVLAAIERERPEPGARRERLAARLGGAAEGAERPRMSDLRFQRLIRSEGDELGAALRRALPLAGESCDVAAFAREMLAWLDEDRPERGEQVRIDWCFDYFGAARPGGEGGSDIGETSKDKTA